MRSAILSDDRRQRGLSLRKLSRFEASFAGSGQCGADLFALRKFRRDGVEHCGGFGKFILIEQRLSLFQRGNIGQRKIGDGGSLDEVRLGFGVFLLSNERRAEPQLRFRHKRTLRELLHERREGRDRFDMLVEVRLRCTKSVKCFWQDRRVGVRCDHLLVRDDRVRLVDGEIQALGLVVRRVSRERTLRELAGTLANSAAAILKSFGCFDV